MSVWLDENMKQLRELRATLQRMKRQLNKIDQSPEKVENIFREGAIRRISQITVHLSATLDQLHRFDKVQAAKWANKAIAPPGALGAIKFSPFASVLAHDESLTLDALSSLLMDSDSLVLGLHGYRRV